MIKDPPKSIPRISLTQGQVCFTRESCRICTVLGPCVAVTLYAQRYSAASMCHAVLPSPATAREQQAFARSPGRWVTGAIPAMFECFRSLRIPAAEIQAKVFGGASIMPSGHAPDSRMAVGSRNVDCAIEELGRLRLRIVSSHIGGNQGRNIIFNTETGEVLLRCFPAENQMKGLGDVC